jgi:hypothetical protein
MLAFEIELNSLQIIHEISDHILFPEMCCGFRRMMLFWDA